MAGGRALGGTPNVARALTGPSDIYNAGMTVHPIFPCSLLAKLGMPGFGGPQTLANWGIIDLPLGTETGSYAVADVANPQVWSDVSAAILQAEAKGLTVRARGSGWSFSDALFPLTEVPSTAQPTPPAGVVVNTDGLNHDLSFLLPSIRNSDLSMETYCLVEGGWKLSDLNDHLNGLPITNYQQRQSPSVALPTLGGSAGQSLAGAIATGTHGMDFDRPPLADAVRALYIIGAGGVHHWVEGSLPVTDPTKLSTIFPCLLPENIHYDDEFLRACLVSFGGMGVVYAVMLAVVPQFWLAQATSYSTWESLQQNKPVGAGADLAGAFDGSLTGILGFVRGHFNDPSFQSTISQTQVRSLQVLIDPIRGTDGSHICAVTNRATVPWQSAPSGEAPLGFDSFSQSITSIPASVPDILLNDPNLDFGAWVNILCWAFDNLLNKPLPQDVGGDVVLLQSLLQFAEFHGYDWLVRDIIEILMRLVMPEWVPQDLSQYPRIDVGYKIMGNGGFNGAFPPHAITSTEVFFDATTGIGYVNRLMGVLDQATDDRRYFPGYISLRFCGPTRALLGMQMSHPTACIEVAGIDTEHAREIVVAAEQLALSMGGALHWGQSNGSMTAAQVLSTYGRSSVAVWKVVQSLLGGTTFSNAFMERLGLVSPPVKLGEQVTPTKLQLQK